MWFLLVVVIRGVATVIAVIIVVVIVSFIESLVHKESLYLLRILFFVCCNRQLEFVNKGSKVIW